MKKCTTYAKLAAFTIISDDGERVAICADDINVMREEMEELREHVSSTKVKMAEKKIELLSLRRKLKAASKKISDMRSGLNIEDESNMGKSKRRLRALTSVHDGLAAQGISNA